MTGAKRKYSITQYNIGTPDLKRSSGNLYSYDRVGKGRDTLPLTELQLAEVGLSVAGIE